jgi:hypothetical protein
LTCAIIANDRQLAAIIAGLRLIEHEMPSRKDLPECVSEILDAGETIQPLSEREIDDLCDSLAMPHLNEIEDADRATILAALRFYQTKGQGDPENRSDAIHEIATGNDAVISLDAEGIEDLYQRISQGAAV